MIRYLLLTILFPTVLSVNMIKGRENRFDNGYYETTNDAFQNQCLQWHNYYRRFHGAAPLTYDPTLANFARYRAIQLAKKDGTNFYHPDGLQYGENLAWNSQTQVDCGLPMKLWYDEWKIYNFQRPNISPRTGHFTQMVWKETARVGCGQAVSQGASGGTFTVCTYDPPGNYRNEELQNVVPAFNGGGVASPDYPTKRIKIYKKTFWVAKHQNSYNGYNQPAKSYSSNWYNFMPHTYGKSYAKQNYYY